MFNKRHIITSSAIILLALSNVSNVYAEEQSTVGLPNDQSEETEVIQQESNETEQILELSKTSKKTSQESIHKVSEETLQQFHQILNELNELLTEEQQETITSAQESSQFHLFVEAIVLHTEESFEEANILYEQLLNNEETSENYELFIRLLYESSLNNIHIINIDYSNLNTDETNEETDSITKEDIDNKVKEDEGKEIKTSSNRAIISLAPQNIQASADELYNRSMYATFASDAWNAAIEFKNEYPSDERVIRAINKAGNRIFTLGVNNHDKENYDLALDYYNRILSEDSVDSDILQLADTYSKRANNNEPIKEAVSADKLYNEAMYATFASDAWNAALELKLQYPSDERLTQAINEAASRIFTLGVKNHRRGNYNLALDYYNRILLEDLVAEVTVRQANVYTGQASNQQPLQTADELYNDAMYATFASDAWDAAKKLKNQYPSDQRINRAINRAANRMLTLGVNNHNNGNYSAALEYYNQILLEDAVENKTRQTAESYSKRARNNGPIQTADELYNDAMYATFASEAWEASLDLKSQYPSDARIETAINKAAVRMLTLGKSNHQQGNYSLAINYYNQVLSEDNVNSVTKIEASGYYTQTQENTKLQTADELYQGVMNAQFGSEAWEAAQQLRMYFPSDYRLTTAINKTAERMYILGTNNHENGNYELALDYYNKILSDDLVESALRNQVNSYKGLAEDAKELESADSLYDRAMNAPFASEAWDAAQDLQSYFPNDGRISTAINNSAQRLYTLGTNNHRNGNYELAQDYYNRILSDDEVSSSLRKEASVYNNQAKENKQLRTADEMYEDAMNARLGSDAWKYANELATYFSGERTNHAISDSGNRILILGTQRHNIKDYEGAIHYYDMLLTSPYTDTAHKVKADSYKYLAQNSYSLSNLVIRNVSYNYTFEETLNIQMKNSPQIWDSSVSNGPWRNATRTEVAKYLDPSRVQSNSDFLQFLRLAGSSGISVNDLNKELKNAGILKSMGDVFREASQKANINELYLISHALLESGNGTSNLATGILVDEVDGKKVTPRTVYNMFGIGAVDSAPDKKGAERAYKLGWFTPEQAVIGGAEWISSRYINNKTYNQNTLYKMRWNPETPGTHQYATDIAWAYKQTGRLMRIVDLAQKYDLVLNFEVPLYD